MKYIPYRCCSTLSQVVKLEKSLSERQTTMESLCFQLAAVLEEHALCERELGGRRKELATREMQLRVRAGVCVCVACYYGNP